MSRLFYLTPLNYFSNNSQYPSVAISLKVTIDLTYFLVEKKIIGLDDTCVIMNFINIFD